MPTPGQSVSVLASASVAPSSNYKLKDADGIVLGESSVTDDMRAIVSANIPLYRKGRELSLGIMPYYHFSGMRLKEDFGLNFGNARTYLGLCRVIVNSAAKVQSSCDKN